MIFIDIDECLTNNGGCDEQAKCKNTEGSFTCDFPINEKDESNQAVGIGVGVSFGLLAFLLFILLIFFFLRKKVKFIFLS
mgnify:CR=1 FL=1